MSRVGSTCGTWRTRQGTTQQLLLCRFDDADNNDDNDNGHCEAYNDTHLKSSQPTCLARQHEPTFISFHLTPPQVRKGIGTMKQKSLPHILVPVSNVLCEKKSTKLTLRTRLAPRRKPWAETARLSVGMLKGSRMHRDYKKN